jgi:hypothetical protein
MLTPDADDVPLVQVMATLLALTDEVPNGGYLHLYKAALDARLPTRRRGREYVIARENLPIAARIVGLTLTADPVAEAVSPASRHS